MPFPSLLVYKYICRVAALRHQLRQAPHLLEPSSTDSSFRFNRIMVRPQTPQGSLRQRNVGSKKADSPEAAIEVELDKLAKAAAQKNSTTCECDHWVAFSLTTVLAFVTRFWGISHPNEVVFDEVHFGKVCLIT